MSSKSVSKEMLCFPISGEKYFFEVLILCPYKSVSREKRRFPIPHKIFFFDVLYFLTKDEVKKMLIFLR